MSERSELHYHRITRIATADLTSRYPRLVGKNARLGSHGTDVTSPMVLIATDQGATGWGRLCGPPDQLSRLIQRRVSDVFDPAHGVLVDEALPLDVALHDLAGVILNQPVYQLLGGHGATAVPCYDGAIYMDDLDPEAAPRGIAAVLENCADDYARGYRAFKLKIGRGYRWIEAAAGLQRDIAVTRAVRERFPTCDLLVDANDGYTAELFLCYLDGVRDCQLFWVEEPFPEHRAGLLRLRHYLAQQSPETLVADGEAQPDLPLLLDLAREHLLDVLLMDIVGFGVTAWRRIMPTLRELGVKASPHTWGEPVKTVYAAQLAAGLGNVVTVEGVPGVVDTLDCSGYRLVEGRLYLPDRPGWGLPPPLELQTIQGRLCTPTTFSSVR